MGEGKQSAQFALLRWAKPAIEDPFLDIKNSKPPFQSLKNLGERVEILWRPLGIICGVLSSFLSSFPPF